MKTVNRSSMATYSRDDFPKHVKEILASRVGHKCSKPDCRAPTSGPRTEAEKVVNVGVAAHITAAAPGGPRYDASMPPAQRADASNGIWLCQTHGKQVDNDPLAFSAEMLREWKESAEQLAREEIGQRQGVPPISPRSSEDAISAKLRTRDELKKLLLKAPKDIVRRGPVLHPYEKFAKRKVIIRSVDDESYPQVDESTTGMSTWFRVEMFDFYHDGIECIVGIGYVLVGADDRWRPQRWQETPDLSRFRQVKAWELLRIPFRNIRLIDAEGDEYYREPHLYCVYADGGAPYEELRWAVCADDDEWDFPFDPGLMLPESATEEEVLDQDLS